MMKYIILYFSGTGNTELIARQINSRIKHAGHSTSIHSIEDMDKILSLDFNNSIVGFGFPVYKFTYPDIFHRIIPRLLSRIQGCPVFYFATYTRFAASAVDDFANAVGNTHEILAAQSFKAPSCGISARRCTTSYEYQSVMFFEDEIDQQLDHYTEKLLHPKAHVYVPKPSGPLQRFQHRIVEDIEITKYPKLTIDTHQCIQCGQCARECPDHNLTSTSTSIHITDDLGCLHCLRCMNRCPVNAINFGPLTIGQGQYSQKDRDTLFQQALSGQRSPYWRDFKRIVKRWRRKTIRYWMQQKLRGKQREEDIK